MQPERVTLRDIQRRYRNLVDTVKRATRHLYLGTRSKSEAVLLDVETFEELQDRATRKKQSWGEVKKILEEIRKDGTQGVNLAEFVRKDRRTHAVYKSSR